LNSSFIYALHSRARGQSQTQREYEAATAKQTHERTTGKEANEENAKSLKVL
jgi:hypothetical protein